MSISGDDYLGELSRSDLTVEEQLAGGATVGDLISAGVLHDDYPAGCDFTEEVSAPQQYDGPPMSDKRHERNMARLNRFNSGRYLTEDAPPRSV